MRNPRSRPLACLLAAATFLAALALSLVGSLPAYAATESSSAADAYGGQAAVLGKPQRQHTHLGSSGVSKASNSGVRGSGPRAGRGVSSSHPPGGSSSATSSGSGAGAAGVLAGRSQGGSTDLGQEKPPATSQVSGAISLSALDVLLLVALIAIVIGSGVAIRRLSRFAR